MSGYSQHSREVISWRDQLASDPATGAPGELLAHLSDPASTVTGLVDTTARPVDAAIPRRRYINDYLTCTLPDGYPSKHQLAQHLRSVSNHS